MLNQENSLFEIFLQYTYLPPLLRGGDILVNLCRISKNSALFKASLFYSTVNKRHVSMHHKRAFNFNTLQRGQSFVSI